MPWPVLRMTACRFLTATMCTTKVLEQWWRPVLRLSGEVHEDEEAQGNMEAWFREEHEENRAGV